jgi:hypothetical protein
MHIGTTWKPLALVPLPVLGMGVSVLIQLLTFKKVKGALI